MGDNPDYDSFHTLLLQAARQALAAVRRDHPDETFYAFGLFHEPLWAYIEPTANTEEGLIRRAEEYQLDKYQLGYARQSIEELAANLRWNPGDWVYHAVGEEFFEPVQKWLDDSDIYWKYDGDEDRQRTMHDRLYVICEEVLRTLDGNGLFGFGEARERVVVNILLGDEDGHYLLYGRALNPPNTFKRFLADLTRARFIPNEEAALAWIERYEQRRHGLTGL